MAASRPTATRSLVPGPARPRPVAVALAFTLCLASLSSAPAGACPEVIVPMEFGDTAFKSRAWKRAMATYKKHRHSKALKAFRTTSAALEKDVKKLFQPKTDDDAVRNTVIQKWLRQHVYTPNPGVLIVHDRFSYPAQVWRAWSDSACHAGAYREALLALDRVQQLQPDANLSQQRTMVLLRLGRFDAARQTLKKAPPDAFFTPFAEHLLARHEGDLALARQKLEQAAGVSDLPARNKAIDAARKALAASAAP